MAVFELVTHVLRALDRSQSALGAFCDLSRAFDSVSPRTADMLNVSTPSPPRNVCGLFEAPLTSLPPGAVSTPRGINSIAVCIFPGNTSSFASEPDVCTDIVLRVDSGMESFFYTIFSSVCSLSPTHFP
ncbi:hypothetical protein J6590_069910 [Homalodisca vitripennis]|nr:hypothetical protein J6590_069910 [Homalodisca vitripennis]